MPVLRNKKTGRDELVPDQLVEQAAASGEYDVPEDVRIQLTTPAGRVIQGSPQDVALAQGTLDTTVSTPGQAGAAERAAYLEQEHGGLAGTAGAFVGQAASAATFGLSDLFVGSARGPGFEQTRREQVEANPTAAGLGEAAGLLAPALLSGGAGAVGAAARATPAGLASSIGTRIAESGLEHSLGQAAAGYAVEGALYGAGHVISETILQDKEFSAQAFLAGAGEGAALGGIGGLGVSLFGRGARAAKRRMDSLAANRAVASLEAEERTALKEAQKAAKAAERAKLEVQRHQNRVELEQLRQQGRIEAIGARGEVAGVGAEARVAVADKRLAAEVAKADATAIAAKARAESASEALAAERAKYETAKMVMDGRIKLSETYTAGWRRAAESREQVADQVLEGTGISADAKIRTGLADALAKSGRPDAGYVIEDLIPAKLRSPEAVEAAKGEVMNHAVHLAAETDDLVRQADELMAVNPAAATELRALRDRAAEAAPAVRDWTEKQAASRAFQEENLAALEAAGFSGPPGVRGLRRESMKVGGKDIEIEAITRNRTAGDPWADVGQIDESLPMTTYVRARRTLADGEVVDTATAEFSHRADSLYPESVSVEPAMQRQGLGTRMYDLAQESSGGKAVLESSTQTEAGKAFRSAREGRFGAREEGATTFRPLAPEEVPTVSQELHEFAAANWTEDDFRNVRVYHRDRESYIINAALRGEGTLDAEQQEIVAGLDSLFSRPGGQLPRDLLLHPSDMVLYRGVRQGTEMPAVGDVMTDPAFTFTSLDPRIGAKYSGKEGESFVVEIEAPAGTPAVALGGFENPVLLPRNTPLRVLESNPETRVVRARVDYGDEVAPAAVDRAAPAAEPAPPTEFAAEMETIRGAEEAHHQLAQALRPYADDVTGMSLDEAMAGMDGAVTKQEEIVTDALTRQAEAAVEGAANAPLPTMPPMPGAPAAAPGRAAGGISNALGVLDLAAALGGLPNANDIPVIGPLLGTYLKFRAMRGALGRVGFRVGGPVARIARGAAQTQDTATRAIAALVSGAEKATIPLSRATPPLTTVLGRSLWELDEDEKPVRPVDDAPAKKPQPQKLFEKRREELLRVADDPQAAREELAETIPAPPALAAAIADAAVSRLEWLAGLLPPETQSPSLRPTPVRASANDIERLAIGIAATADPVGMVLGGIVRGAVHPLAVQALREVFPRLYAQMQADVIEAYATSRAVVPYMTKLNLSSVFEVPLDATLQPEYLASRQQEYADAAAQEAPAPTAGPQLQISAQSELGPMRRAMR